MSNLNQHRNTNTATPTTSIIDLYEPDVPLEISLTSQAVPAKQQLSKMNQILRLVMLIVTISLIAAIVFVAVYAIVISK